jgi:hypothetical protein
MFVSKYSLLLFVSLSPCGGGFGASSPAYGAPAAGGFGAPVAFGAPAAPTANASGAPASGGFSGFDAEPAAAPAFGAPAAAGGFGQPGAFGSAPKLAFAAPASVRNLHVPSPAMLSFCDCAKAAGA